MGRNIPTPSTLARGRTTWRREEQSFPRRLDDAKVFAQTICLVCHRLGDFKPTRPDQAPDLADVYHRLRPEFLRHWIANPKRLLPYTGMPENQLPPPPKGPLDKRKAGDKGNFGAEVGHLFDPTKSGATSEDQLDAVIDFLLNYDRYTARDEKIEQLKAPDTKEADGKEKDKSKPTVSPADNKSKPKGTTKPPGGG